MKKADVLFSILFHNLILLNELHASSRNKDSQELDYAKGSPLNNSCRKPGRFQKNKTLKLTVTLGIGA